MAAFTAIRFSRSRLDKRESTQTWRDRLIGKRIVSSDRHISEHEGWKSEDMKNVWEPRVYFCTPIGEGFEKDLKYTVQDECRLLKKLPTELRLQILAYVLPPHVVSHETQAEGKELEDSVGMNTSAVIFSCKQLYAEGRALAMDLHTFEWNKFPKKTRLCATIKDRYSYDWEV